MLTVAQVAAAVGGTVEGDGSLRLSDMCGLEEAGPEHLSFLANRRYLKAMRSTRAGAVLVGRDDDALGRTVVRCSDPYAAFAQALRLFHPLQRTVPGIHPQAVVEGTAEGATVMAFAYVGPGAQVGEGTVLQPFVYVGAGAVVGQDCLLMPGSVVMDGCVLGDRVVLNPGAVIGGDGFGFAPTPQGLLKIPQVGRAVLESDVEIGANSCVDRSAMGDTRIGHGSKLDNLVQVGHAARMGPHCTVVALSGIGGSAQVGAGVTVAAGAKVLGHFSVGDGTQVGAMSLLTGATPPGARRSGVPAMEHDQWLQMAADLPRLHELLERVRLLEQEVASLRQTTNRPDKPRS